MAIVTVVGSSGMTVQVTVEGARMQTLASSYAKQILDATKSGNLTSVDLVNGSNAGPSSANSVIQGVVTTGGAFSMQGKYSNLVIGAQGAPYLSPEETTPVAPLNSPVAVDATGVVTDNLSILAGNTAGVSFYAGNYNGTFVSTMGNNLFHADDRTGNWTIATGDGNDTIVAGNGVNNIRAGEGENLITLGAGANFVASEGQDTITGVENASDTVTLLGGNSIVTLQSNSAVVDAALVGSRISVGINSTVFGGTGSTVDFTGNSGTIVGAIGDTISAAGDLSVYHGCDQSISVSGALKFISGTGNTSINAGLGTIWGANDLRATVDTNGLALFTANQPNTTGSQYIDASSSKGTLEAWTGAGNNTVIGTSGSDHFVFGTQFENSNGDSFATVTGGDGAANTFGVLAGHNGGDITITDFGSAAGNMFFMYNYKPADADQAVKDLLATATVTGGNTTLQLDNNMKVTFLGVTDLKASNFQIS
ncbi:calcium-binding protein [Asaia sp. As-1742]|uniref:calcium-binding protein n=1 Tax=Asaia sp. As-1742 TaxID=2608325 RepID=UPI0014201DA4|nr:calcium-binding protein [Asaia sp. As-1742]NIE81777.1 calcium-binding protein [Asaia sp. As-1742]